MMQFLEAREQGASRRTTAEFFVQILFHKSKPQWKSYVFAVCACDLRSVNEWLWHHDCYVSITYSQ